MTDDTFITLDLNYFGEQGGENITSRPEVGDSLQELFLKASQNKASISITLYHQEVLQRIRKRHARVINLDHHFDLVNDAECPSLKFGSPQQLKQDANEYNWANYVACKYTKSYEWWYRRRDSNQPDIGSYCSKPKTVWGAVITAQKCLKDIPDEFSGLNVTISADYTAHSVLVAALPVLLRWGVPRQLTPIVNAIVCAIDDKKLLRDLKLILETRNGYRATMKHIKNIIK